MFNPYQRRTTTLLSVIIIALCTVFTIAQGQRELPPLTVTSSTADKCPRGDIRQGSLSLIRNAIYESIQYLQCGPGEWRRVFYLNASKYESDQSCPGQWNQVNNQCTGAERSCSSAFSDKIISYYGKVCGRIIGEGVETTDAFNRFIPNQNTIEDNYLDGVSVTHGAPGSRTHIWSFAASPNDCPCDNSNRNFAPLPPAEVGDNYFCDRADGLDQVWTGESCTSDNPCCSFHNPPYFSIQLPAATTDRIELRICTDQHFANEPVLVLLTELYVQ